MKGLIAQRHQIERQVVETLNIEGIVPPRPPASARGGAAAGAAGRAEVERLKAERERLGGVNLGADARASRCRRGSTSLVKDRDDLVAADRKLSRRHPKPQPRGNGCGSPKPSKKGQRLLPGAVHLAVRRRARRSLQFVRERTIRSKPGSRSSPAARQEALDHDAALGWRAGADRDEPDLCGVPHQPRRDLRARRGGRPLDDANVERFCTLLDTMMPAHRDAVPGHHPQPPSP